MTCPLMAPSATPAPCLAALLRAAAPIARASASEGWRTDHASRDTGSAPAFSQGLLRMASSTPGDLLFMDFRFPHARTRVRRLDVLYAKASADGPLRLAVPVDGGAETLAPLTRLDARLRSAPGT